MTREERNAAQNHFADFDGTRTMLICINRTGPGGDYYEAVRYAWKVNVARAEQAELVLAHIRGEIVAAYEPHTWLEANRKNFPKRKPQEGRWGFVGEETSDKRYSRFVGKLIPPELRSRGPIRYTY